MHKMILATVAGVAINVSATEIPGNPGAFACHQFETSIQAAEAVKNECRHDMPMLSPTSSDKVIVCCTKTGGRPTYINVATYK